MPPETRTHSTTAAALTVDIEALIAAKDNPKLAPAKAMFESVIRVLGIVKGEMIEDQAFVELAQLCSKMCHVLETTTEEKDFCGLKSKRLRKALESLERTLCHIESRVSGSVPGAYHPQERRSGTIEVSPALWEAELRNVLDIIGDTLICSGNGKRPQPRGNPYLTPEMITLSTHVEPPDPGEKALQNLISGTTTHGQTSSLVEAVFSSENAIKAIGCLEESDAQAFIDVAHQALESPDVAPNVRMKYLKPLYRVCAGRGLLPRSLQFKLVGGLTGIPSRCGGFANVWKCEHRGQQLAVKVLRTGANVNMRKITLRFCKEFVAWRALQHPNVLPLLGVEMLGGRFAMVSEWMPNGNINEFLRVRWDVNRFELLKDVAKGLAYMHEQEMVHGDLKGANILIDGNRRARLADFGLLRIISNPAPSSSLFTNGGTLRWMSPELLFAEESDPKYQPTKASDCYALGMVSYEVLSGKIPFYSHKREPVVWSRVRKGEHPKRPRGVKGVWVTNDVWKVLERCWKYKPEDRPTIGSVLRHLEEWTPSPRMLALAGPLSCSSDSDTEGSMDEDQASSLLQVTLPQTLWALLPQVLRRGVSDNRDPETDDKDLKELADIHDRSPSASGCIREPLDEGSPQLDPPASRGTLVGDPLMILGVKHNYNGQKAEVSALGLRSERGQYPSASRPLGTFVQITCEWVTSQGPLIGFFFF